MTIANTAVAKLSVAFVAVAMALTLAAPAQAQTVEELQAQIAEMLATIAGLQGGGSTGGSSMSSSCASIPAPLTMGAQNGNVTALQNFLIGAGQSIPAGATGYFGGQTRSALAGWQAANGVAPAVGYYGPITKAAIDASCVVTDNGDDSMDDSDDSSDDSDDNSPLQGEASLDRFEVDDAQDSNVEEGDSDAEIAELTVEFADGDAEISRVDVKLVSAANTGDEVDPWDTFDNVSLWIDGDKVADTDSDSKSDYLGDEDDGVLRFTGLDIRADEDEEVLIVVAADIAGSIDGTSNGNDWTITVDSIRFVDGDDVTTTDGSTDGLGGTDSADVTIDEAGSEDELIVKTSSNDPDATTLALDDSKKSDWFSVFAFDIDTDDSINDIIVNEIAVTVTVSSSTYDGLVSDAELVIDGTTIGSLNDGNGATAGDYTDGASVTLLFDVDGEVEINAGDRIEAELMLEFNSLAAGDEGTTVMAAIASVDNTVVDAEGAEDLENSQLSGSATGEAHTLRTMGITVEAGDVSAVVTAGDNALDDYATYKVEMEVTAFEQDAFIALDEAVSLVYAIETSAGVAVVGTPTPVLTSTADDDGTYYEVNEGSTETFTFTVTFDPTSANEAARLQIDSIEFAASASAPDQSWAAQPDEDYRTDVVTMVN